jgi:hypothetical protein
MTKREIVKDTEFEEVTEVKADSKNRISLGRLGQVKVFSYKVYRNSLGQFILDPQAAVPAHEAWLFKNEKAKREVQQGLLDAGKGRLVKAKEDYSKYLDDSR